MPFELVRMEETFLEKRLRKLHFQWRGAVAAGDLVTALHAALEWDALARKVYGDDFIEEALDEETEPANDL